MVEARVENCSACGQTLWSLVRHCPFCAAPTAPVVADVADTAEAAAVAAVVAPAPVVAPPPAPADKPVEAPAPARKTPPKAAPAAPVASEKPAKSPAPHAAPAPAAAKAKLPESASTPGAPVAAPAKRSPKLLIGVALAGVLGYWFLSSGPSAPDACDQSLAQAQSAMQQDNAQQARQHAQAAIAACQDKKRAPLAKSANDGAQALLKTQAQAQARAEQQSRQLAQQQRQQQSACENGNRQTANHLRSGRLESAAQNLQRTDQACRQMGETQAVIAQYEGMRSTASKATADARAQLAQGALAQARTSLEVLASVNRESDDLPEMRAALNKAQAAAVPAPSRAAPESGAQPGAQSGAQSELLRSFLRDAETSMQQRLYDKAKTYAESAQRIDPRNPEVARLLRRIKEHEMSYLRERIVIE